MALRRVYTSRPCNGLPPQHRATIIVGDVVGQAPGDSLKVKITHSYNPDFPVGSLKLLCGKRCKDAFMDGEKVLDEATLVDVTPEPLPTDSGERET